MIIGVDVNKLDHFNCTPLYLACVNNDVSIVKLLLCNPDINVNVDVNVDVNVNVNAVDLDTGNTSLHIAVEKHNVNIVKLLIQQPHVNVNIQNNKGCTPLHLACRYGNIDIVNVLLGFNGINVNIKTDGGYTPLSNACIGRYIEVIDALLHYDNLNINCDAPLPLILSSLDSNTDVIKMLLCHPNIDVHKKNNKNFTALMAMCERHYNYLHSIANTLQVDTTEHIKYLLCKNYNPSTNIIDDEQLDHYEIIKQIKQQHSLLLPYKAKIDTVSYIFTLVVLVCDNYFTLKQNSYNLDKQHQQRFFNICTQLPMEIQMIICHRVCGSRKDIISSLLVNEQTKIIFGTN